MADALPCWGFTPFLLSTQLGYHHILDRLRGTGLTLTLKVLPHSTTRFFFTLKGSEPIYFVVTKHVSIS